MQLTKSIDIERMIKSQLKRFKFSLDAFKDTLEERWKTLMDLESLSFYSDFRWADNPQKRKKQKIQLWMNTSQKCSFSFAE